MWRGCLQAVRSTQTDRRVRKHARRTWSVSAQHEGDRVAGVSYAQRLKWKIRGGGTTHSSLPPVCDCRPIAFKVGHQLC